MQRVEYRAHIFSILCIDTSNPLDIALIVAHARLIVVEADSDLEACIIANIVFVLAFNCLCIGECGDCWAFL